MDESQGDAFAASAEEVRALGEYRACLAHAAKLRKKAEGQKAAAAESIALAEDVERRAYRIRRQLLALPGQAAEVRS